MKQPMPPIARCFMLACICIAIVVPPQSAAAIGYELIPGGYRRGSVSLSASQAGQTSTANPLINPPDPLLPDANWTGPNITLGGIAPLANVTAQGEATYRLTTTPDSIDIRVRTNASRFINGGINTSTTASALTQCSIAFRLPQETRLTVSFSIARTGFPTSTGYTLSLRVFPTGEQIYEINAPGSETLSFSVDPGNYYIIANAIATPTQNASASVELVATVSGMGGGCPADFNSDGFLDFTDFDDFVVAFEGGQAASDFNADGFLDFTDFDAFVNAFEGGC